MLKKVLLAGVIIGPVLALAHISDASQWDVGLPLGSIFLALYLIVTFINKLEHDGESDNVVTHTVSANSAVSGKEIFLRA